MQHPEKYNWETLALAYTEILEHFTEQNYFDVYLYNVLNVV